MCWWRIAFPLQWRGNCLQWLNLEKANIAWVYLALPLSLSQSGKCWAFFTFKIRSMYQVPYILRWLLWRDWEERMPMSTQNQVANSQHCHYHSASPTVNERPLAFTFLILSQPSEADISVLSKTIDPLIIRIEILYEAKHGGLYLSF